MKQVLDVLFDKRIANSGAGMKQLLDVLFDRIITNIVKLLCAVLVVVVLLQIFSRTFMPQTYSWTEEISRLTFVWFCMLSTTLTLKKKLHIGVDFLYMKTNLVVRRILDLLINGLIVLFGGILVVCGILLLDVVSDQYTEILRWPAAVYYSSVPIAGALFVLFSSYRIGELLKHKGAVA